MPLEWFEPTIPASERPQTYALDRAATAGTGKEFTLDTQKAIFIFLPTCFKVILAII
jgi:hypothetical protein